MKIGIHNYPYNNCKKELQTIKKEELIFKEQIQFIKLMPISSNTNGDKANIDNFLNYIKNEKNQYFSQPEESRILHYIKKLLLQNDETELNKFEKKLTKNEKYFMPFVVEEDLATIATQETSVWTTSSNFFFTASSNLMDKATTLIQSTSERVYSKGQEISDISMVL